MRAASATLLLLFLTVTPLTGARPWVGPIDVGVATQDSHEVWWNVRNDVAGCEQVTIPVRIELTLVVAAPTDRVLLDLLDITTGKHKTAIASPGEPAVVEGWFPNPCTGEFTVDGLSVAAGAVYRWKTTTLIP